MLFWPPVYPRQSGERHARPRADVVRAGPVARATHPAEVVGLAPRGRPDDPRWQCRRAMAPLPWSQTAWTRRELVEGKEKKDGVGMRYTDSVLISRVTLHHDQHCTMIRTKKGRNLKHCHQVGMSIIWMRICSSRAEHRTVKCPETRWPKSVIRHAIRIRWFPVIYVTLATYLAVLVPPSFPHPPSTPAADVSKIRIV